MKERCTLPQYETRLVDMLTSGIPVYKQLSTLLSKLKAERLEPALLRFYAYVRGEPVLVVIWARGDSLLGACVETGEGSFQGDRCLEILSQIMSDTETMALVEVLSFKGGEKELGRYKFSRPMSPEKIAEMSGEAKKRVEKPSPTALESMDGIQIGLLLSEVIVASRLLFTAKTPSDALRRARNLSRRNQGSLFRVALITRDGGMYNIFVKAGRVKRVLHLSPSGIEGRIVGEEEPLKEILKRDDIVRITVYRVDCPRCEKLILGD
ncbi:MAG: hypothetical protein F7C35_00900 [Desulfurococcales archaeon]|nr:hypothetical protein [Desulfurococcales archaeon]